MTADKAKYLAVRTKPSRTPVAGSGPTEQISSALRSAYEQAVQEQVPNEFMDLLSKLS